MGLRIADDDAGGAVGQRIVQRGVRGGRGLVELAAGRAVVGHIIEDIPLFEHDVLAVGLPGFLGGVSGRVVVVAGVVVAVENAHVDLAVPLDFDAADRDGLLVGDDRAVAANQADSTELVVVQLGFRGREVVEVLELIHVQPTLGQLVGIFIDFIFREGLAEGIVEDVDQAVIQREVAAVHDGRVAGAAGAHRMARHTDPGGVNEAEGAEECFGVEQTHRRQISVQAFNTLVVFIVVGLGAGSGAIGADVQHHEVSAGELFRPDSGRHVSAAAAVGNNNSGIEVLTRGAGGIIELAVELCAAGVNGNAFHFQITKVRLHKAREEAADQNQDQKKHKQLFASLSGLEGEAFHFLSP